MKEKYKSKMTMSCSTTTKCKMLSEIIFFESKNLIWAADIVDYIFNPIQYFLLHVLFPYTFVTPWQSTCITIPKLNLE